jgi:hypothetical protein
VCSSEVKYLDLVQWVYRFCLNVEVILLFFFVLEINQLVVMLKLLFFPNGYHHVLFTLEVIQKLLTFVVEDLVHVGDHEDLFHVLLHIYLTHFAFHVGGNEEFFLALFGQVQH